MENNNQLTYNNPIDNVGNKYSGIIVPAVTPLTQQLQIDTGAVANLFAIFYKHHISPFILGTTGEAASLSIQQKKDYVLAAEQNKKSGSLLYAGISSNVVAKSIEFAEFCKLHSVDVLVSTLPSYYMLTEHQMLKYFETMADNTPLPLFIYNIPATTHMSIPLHIINELSKHKNIIGVKDSERSEERMMESLRLWKTRTDFSYVLGWAAKSADALLNGANGLVPSTGNIYPEVYEDMLNAFSIGNSEKMHELQKLSDDYGAMYQANRTLGQSLAALKLMMKEKGICEEYVMPPL
jgi:dihydrodipicolinate synthase/N-acetylneuraminate lyase